MGSFIRLVIGVPVAAIVTVFLFYVMQDLIKVDEVDQPDEVDDVTFSINDEVAEVEARVRDTTIDDVQQVDPPPPPPQIERQRAEQPSEGLATVMGAIPDFEAPQLNSDSVSFSVSDRDAQPLVRIEPQYPLRAAERGIEGSCWVRFDVTPDGTPTNIDIYRCDSSFFERASSRAVERWRYNPKVENGVPVARRGVETRFDFRLAE
ncbi:MULTISPECIES: energy transducer TonB [Maricaulis]|jgi:protein TonB|uniref:Protein TonB n=1 Tax=Maricaulis maris (strain MCS10) TaxID=394221 RepID=Q0ARC1_MARMM|nr:MULTISPECIES: energy transducer TonB [Maricaulis]ABI65166.1 outer membrane transport energization protein TonB [Maricaulis maris MCS10]MAC88739.1 energy transducer TonB [Maricaulis sp.]